MNVHKSHMGFGMSHINLLHELACTGTGAAGGPRLKNPDVHKGQVCGQLSWAWWQQHSVCVGDGTWKKTYQEITFTDVCKG